MRRNDDWPLLGRKRAGIATEIAECPERYVEPHRLGVVAGDAVYNGVHQYLAESGNGGIQKWIQALDKIASLQPRKVVASHKNPALDDDPTAIDATRRYLQDAERLSQTTHSALEFYNSMLELYPERLNPTALWFWGAQVLFPPVVGA